MVEQLTTDQEVGMVINDYYAVTPSAWSIFRDVGKITGVGLLDFTEFIFLVSLSVMQA